MERRRDVLPEGWPGKIKFGDVHVFPMLGKVLAVLFSFFAVIASFGIGNMGQVASITESINAIIPADSTVVNLVTGLVVIVLLSLVILGGLKRIATTNESIVPFMAIFFVIGSLVIIAMNITKVPAAFGAIFAGAFNFKSAAGGVGGAIIAQAMTWGFKRGVFSNEAGLGSSVMVHSASNVKEPVVQGLWGIFEVFADTIIVCTCTALVILTSGVVDMETGVSLSGASKLGLATEAFTKSFGTFGGVFLSVAVCLFAFTTLIGNYYYTEGCLRFIMKKEPGKAFMLIYRLCAIALVFVGAVISAGLAWDTADLLQALMVIINVPVIIILAKPAVAALRDYEWQRRKGKLPAYRANANGVKGTDFWQDDQYSLR